MNNIKHTSLNNFPTRFRGNIFLAQASTSQIRPASPHLRRVRYSGRCETKKAFIALRKYNNKLREESHDGEMSQTMDGKQWTCSRLTYYPNSHDSGRLLDQILVNNNLSIFFDFFKRLRIIYYQSTPKSRVLKFSSVK